MIKKHVKKLINEYKISQYHLWHKKTAGKVLESIELDKGKTDPKLINLSNDYALDVLGWKGYAPWLYVYSSIAQTFKNGWIPDNYYGHVVVPKMKGNYGEISEYRALTNSLFKSLDFPDILYKTNGLYLSPEYQVISEKSVMEFLFKDSEIVVFKKDCGGQGKNVIILKKKDFNISKLEKLDNGVFQKYINQHSFFKEIMPNSVATIRITSVINDEGIVSVRACYLRVGRILDTHVRSNTHIRIPIHPLTGALDKYGFSTDWIHSENHPDTEFVFNNKRIPNFKKCIDTAISLHKMVPFSRIIGWDMIIDEYNSVKVMEWNGSYNDIKFSEATQGPCFSDLGWENLWKEN
ncbi:hypothetical protein LCM02_08295 [Lutimonas saemankumensis]|uniref:sugar-transfer associated ATP-grasp domain-containing protein n=1 Tax=Lutimonas saemankumensis TaxID=483016 RepID=UPI001CD5E0EE|nr:sugar-transfer associated ATP-grasp domain-containing protein [Lutimonas saemankumensis]MCA0932448.1 hypothetical protein [Lutimonas saemankumensis]